MARPAGGSGSGKGKKKASAAKPRSPATGKVKNKGPARKKRASGDQIKDQLDIIGAIKDRLKEVNMNFQEAYPNGVNFTPNAKDLDFI